MIKTKCDQKKKNIEQESVVEEEKRDHRIRKCERRKEDRTNRKKVW